MVPSSGRRSSPGPGRRTFTRADCSLCSMQVVQTWCSGRCRPFWGRRSPNGSSATQSITLLGLPSLYCVVAPRNRMLQESRNSSTSRAIVDVTSMLRTTLNAEGMKDPAFWKRHYVVKGDADKIERHLEVHRFVSEGQTLDLPCFVARRDWPNVLISPGSGGHSYVFAELGYE